MDSSQKNDESKHQSCKAKSVEMKTQQADQKVRVISELINGVESDVFLLHSEVMKKLRFKTLRLKKLNGGLSPEEESEFQTLSILNGKSSGVV